MSSRENMSVHALQGLRVADFSWVIAGPLIGYYLAQYGATVIRIESIHRPDVIRLSAPFKDNKPGINRSGQWAAYNGNKLGMALNLHHPKGIEVAKRLVGWSDIVLENFAVGVIDKIGLSYQELRKVKANIIMASTSNLGQSGPEAKHPGYGTTLVSYAGFTSLVGWPDRQPVKPFGAYTDYLAPLFQISAIMAALDYRRRTGKGKYLDISQMESGMQFLAPLILDYRVNNGHVSARQGNASSCAAPHGVYPCRGDDRWCALAIFTDRQWQSLCDIMGKPDWSQNPYFNSFQSRKQNEKLLDEKISEWTVNFDGEELVKKLQAKEIASGIVMNAADVQGDPQLAHRHFFWETEHPDIGRHSYEGAGFMLSKTPGEIRTAAPRLGQDTEYVCREILGMDDKEFVSLLNEGVLE